MPIREGLGRDGPNDVYTSKIKKKIFKCLLALHREKLSRWLFAYGAQCGE
jgi:hypothetical protein